MSIAMARTMSLTTLPNDGCDILSSCPGNRPFILSLRGRGNDDTLFSFQAVAEPGRAKGELVGRNRPFLFRTPSVRGPADCTEQGDRIHASASHVACIAPPCTINPACPLAPLAAPWPLSPGRPRF